MKPERPDRRVQTSARPPKLKAEEERARRRERDRQAEHDLDQPAEAARRVAEGERQAQTMMMITAMMRATSPGWIRMDCSSIPERLEPAACARTVRPAADGQGRRRRHGCTEDVDAS